MSTSRLSFLRQTVAQHDHDYYVGANPTISDREYDELKRELAALEAGLPPAEAVTKRVSSDLTAGFAKVKHASPMLSLDNTFTPAGVLDFFSRPEELVIEPKVDGCSLELTYEAGILVKAVTRGDGTTGDDVSAQAARIATIPKTLGDLASGDPLVSAGRCLRVRGEVLMRRSVFAKLNAAREAEGDEPFANPRNAAAGSLKLKDAAEVASRRLDFIAYWTDLPMLIAASHWEELEWLGRHGFTTFKFGHPHEGDDLWQVKHQLQLPTVASLLDKLDRHRVGLDYDTDGAVIKVDSRARQAELGAGSKSPKWACAFKYPPARVATTLLDIEVTVGHTGQICPNARLKPVWLEGSTISNASLMNMDELTRIGSPGIGDEVWVEKSACIIPRIVGVKQHQHGSSPWQLPSTCPSCSSVLVKDGVHWFCPNHKSCEAQLIAGLKRATGKGALDWDGMGDAQVATLVKTGRIGQTGRLGLVDLFSICKSDVDTLFKPAATKKFLAEQQRVKQAPLWRKLNALNIEGIGKSLSKDLAARFGSLEAIVASPRTELEAILGQVRLASLRAWVEANLGAMDDLDALGFTFSEVAAKGKLTGLSFVITGGLTSGTRDEVQGRIEAAGGTAKGSVTKSTSYLVVGEAPGGNKTKAAAKHNIKVITEAQLYALMGEPMPAAGVDLAEREV